MTDHPYFAREPGAARTAMICPFCLASAPCSTPGCPGAPLDELAKMAVRFVRDNRDEIEAVGRTRRSVPKQRSRTRRKRSRR